MIGEVSAERLRARLQRREEARRVAEERAQRRQVGVDGVQRRRAFFDRFLDVGTGDAGEGGEGAVEGDEEAGLRLGDRGDRRREVLERPPEAGEVGARRDDRPQHRLAVDRPGGAGRRSLRSAAARGRPGRCRSRPGSGGSPSRVGSSNMSKNWSMSTGSGVAAASGIVSPAAKPLEELPGVTCRNLRPSADFGRIIIVESTGSGSAFLSRLSESSAATSPSLELDRDDRLDDADADAADPHLVAFDQGVGVGHPAP